MKQTYQIGDLAHLVGIQVETIRYYEAQRLLPKPPRSRGNYRRYAQEHFDRLLFIRHCRSLDMSLLEIRQLLALKDNPQADCSGVSVLLDEHVTAVEKRLVELTALREQLRELRDRCHTPQAASACAILAGLSTLAPSAPKMKRPRPRRTAKVLHAR